jgi:predicted membrane protein
MAASASRMVLALAGLVVGPVLWAANTQLGQILPYAECRTGTPYSLPLSAVAALLSLGAAGLSWRVSSLRRPGGGVQRFLGSLGAMMGPLVAFALLSQAIATLVISPCAH